MNGQAREPEPPRLHQLFLTSGLATGGARLLRRRLLRRGGLARGLPFRCWLLLCYCHSASLLSGWLVDHSSYIHSVAPHASHSRHVLSHTKEKLCIVHALSFIGLNAGLIDKIVESRSVSDSRSEFFLSYCFAYDIARLCTTISARSRRALRSPRCSTSRAKSTDEDARHALSSSRC
jgi:hypothetical protein